MKIFDNPTIATASLLFLLLLISCKTSKSASYNRTAESKRDSSSLVNNSILSSAFALDSLSITLDTLEIWFEPQTKESTKPVIKRLKSINTKIVRNKTESKQSSKNETQEHRTTAATNVQQTSVSTKEISDHSFSKFTYLFASTIVCIFLLYLFRHKK